MLNNDQRNRLADLARATYRDSPADKYRAAWRDVVDALWEAFTTQALDQLRTVATTPEPEPHRQMTRDHDHAHAGLAGAEVPEQVQRALLDGPTSGQGLDGLAGLAAREAGAYPEPQWETPLDARWGRTMPPHDGPTVADDVESQVGRLATWIMDNMPGEPSQPQGAVDTAIRLLDLNLRATEQAASLKGTVSGLRAELAATLRRLERERQQAADWKAATETWQVAATGAQRTAEAYQETARQATDRLADLERALAGNMPEPPAADAPYPLDAEAHPQVPLPQRVVATRWDVTMPDDQHLDRPFMARAELVGQRWRLEVAWQPDSWQRMGHLGVMPEGTTSWQAREAVVEAAQRSRQYAMDHRALDDSAQAALRAVVQPTTDDA